MDLDSIQTHDILNSFPDKNDYCLSIDNYLNIEKMYQNKYTMLKYYRIIQPYEHRMELREGTTIRYSKNMDHLSCSSIITKVNYFKKTKIRSIILRAHNEKGKDKWEIRPEIYHIFVYNPSVSKFSRHLYRTDTDVFQYLTNYDKNKNETSVFDNKKLMNELLGLDGIDNMDDVDNIDNIDNTSEYSIDNDVKPLRGSKVINAVEDLLVHNKNYSKYDNYDIDKLFDEYKERTDKNKPKKKKNNKKNKKNRTKDVDMEELLMSLLGEMN